MPFVENEQEFIARMDSPHVRAKNGVLHFANSAMWTGVAWEPVEEGTAEFRERMLKYDEIVITNVTRDLAQAEHDFHRIQTANVSQAQFHQYGAGPAPLDEAIDAQERQQLLVFQLREQLAELQQNVEEDRPDPLTAYNARRRIEKDTAKDAAERALSINI